MTVPPADARHAAPARPAAYGWRRLAVTVLIVLALMAIGLVAGRWQWGRYETRHDALNASHRASEQPTVPLDTILSPADASPGEAQWRTVTMTGQIEAGDLVELRGRTIEGTPSIQYLTWIHTQAGDAVLLNLGWTPRAEPSPPVIPGGEVTVTGTVRALESDNGKQGTRIVPAQMAPPGGDVVPAYVMVASACGDQGCLSGVEPVPLPELSLGPHLSYAMQWWLLMIAAAPVAVWLTVRDARHERERHAESIETDAAASHPAGASEHSTRPPKPAARKAARPKPLSDEEIEDAL